MSITFENDNDVIVYAFEKVIAHARRTQQIFAAQCIWWLASIIGLEQGLVNYIDNISSRLNVIIHPEEVSSVERIVSPVPRDIQEDTRQDQVLKECEEFLQECRKLRARNTVKANKSNRINPLASTKKALRIERKKNQKDSSKLEGIDQAEIERRRREGESLLCAWTADRKGSHRVKDCIRSIKLERGTISFPKEYQKIKQSDQQPTVEEGSSESSSEEPLSKKQRQYLQSIPKDTIVKYIAKRK